MKANEALFHLVHSLTQYEADRVRRHLRGEYLSLYHTLLKMDSYDKDAVKKRMGIKTSGSLKNLKNRTLNRIFSILSVNDEDEDRMTVLSRTRVTVEAMLAKGFYSLAERRVQRAVKIAEGLELFGTLVELYQLWRHVGWKWDDALHQYFPERAPSQKRIRQAVEQLMDLTETYDTYWMVVRVVRTPMKPEARTRRIAEAWKALKPFDECLSVRSKVYHLATKYVLHRAEADHTKAAECSARIAELLSGQKHLLDDPAIVKLLARHLYNDAVYQIATEELEEAEAASNRIESLAKAWRLTTSVEPEMQQLVWTLRLNMAAKGLDWNAIGDLLVLVREGLADVAHGETDRLFRTILVRRATELAIYAGRRQDARHFLDRLYTETKKDAAPFIVVMTRIYDAVILIEREEWDLLAAVRRRMMEHFRKNGYANAFTTIWLNMIREACKNPTPPHFHETLRAFRDELAKLEKEPQYFDYCNAFAYSPWVDAKLSGTTVSAILTNDLADLDSPP